MNTIYIQKMIFHESPSAFVVSELYLQLEAKPEDHFERSMSAVAFGAFFVGLLVVFFAAFDFVYFFKTMPLERILSPYQSSILLTHPHDYGSQVTDVVV